ncbi:hypothetical protein MHYP_G00331360 [Metynnis hypsauchen]
MILRSQGMADSSGKDPIPEEAMQASGKIKTTEASLKELTEMLQGFMESQAARDERVDREASRQEQRWRNLQHQFRQLQHQVDQQGEPEEEANVRASGQVGEEGEQRVPPSFREPKLHPLTPEDDIEHFLATFERIAKDRNPKTADEAAQLAEVFISARRSQGPYNFSREQHSSRKSVREDGSLCHAGSRTYFQSRRSPPATHSAARQGDRPVKRTSEEVRCYYCGELGHTKPYCQRRKNRPTLLCTVPRLEPRIVGEQEIGPTISVLINGQQEKALIDTGSTQTLVRESLIPREEWREARVKVSCVHGDERSYPTAEIYLTVDGQTFLVTVAVADQLPYPVVLGQDIPVIVDLLPKSQQCLVMTRAQRAREALAELPFHDSETEVGSCKPVKTKAQRRRERLLRSAQVDQEEPLPRPETPLDLPIPSNIATLQSQDPTLQPWLNKVSEIDGVRQKGTGSGSSNTVADSLSRVAEEVSSGPFHQLEMGEGM